MSEANTPQANAYATGAMAGAGAAGSGIRQFHHPAEAAEQGTKLPRHGRTRNIGTGQVVHIAVNSCEAAQVHLGAPLISDAASLAEALAQPLEATSSEPVPVWVLAVSIAGETAQIALPAHAFNRDEAVEVAWRRSAIVAQRGTLPVHTEG